MCGIADTGYYGYLCIAHTQYCTYLHRSSIADTGYTHALKNIHARARSTQRPRSRLATSDLQPTSGVLAGDLRSLTATNMWQPAQAAIPR